METLTASLSALTSSSSTSAVMNERKQNLSSNGNSSRNYNNSNSSSSFKYATPIVVSINDGDSGKLKAQKVKGDERREIRKKFYWQVRW